MNPFTFYDSNFYAILLLESIYIISSNLLLYLKMGSSPLVQKIGL